MKAIIDYWYKTEINKDQTQVLFKGNWYDILEDREGYFYFMYEGSSIYFEVRGNKNKKPIL